MNKNRYRIIFSKAKNMFIAVAENIKSQSKTSGQTAATNLSVETDSTSFHQLWQVKSIVASMSLFMAFSPVYANIQVDPGAAAANRAVIGVGKNAQGQNVPVVNIQTAKNGISHNVYKQFDVLQPGVVLNNSRGGAKSVIVGNVAANPFLNTGEARVILNEVNSTAATQFLGNLEVAGQRADVIIANPSGIVVNGGGFINANKGILTTGKPQMNADGSLKQFIVDQGKVTINGGANNLGLGGNNNNAEFVDIYARALEMNAQLHAKQGINVITGANTISADLENVTDKTSTAAKPALAVDVKALGGMYANNIFIMGTEKGLGVSNAGTLRAANNLVVTSAGQIQHSGTMESTSPTQGMVNIQTTGTGAEANITSSGLISSKGLLNINSGNDLNITAKEVKVDVGTVSPLILSAKGNLNIAAKANVRNFSTDKGDIYLEGKNITVGAGALIGGNGEINLNAAEGMTVAKAASLSARHGLNLTAQNKIKLDEASLHTTNKDINLQSTNTNKALSTIEVTAGSISAKDHLNIYATGDVSLKNIGFILENNISRLANLNLYSGNNLLWDFSVKALPQFTGKVQAEAANKIDLIGTQLSAKDNIELQANQLNLGSALSSQKEINIVSKVSDLTLAKDLNAQGDINVSTLAGKLTANNLKATSTAGKVSLLAQKEAIFTGTAATKSNLTGAQGVSVGSIGQGDVTVQNVNLQSGQGGVIVSSQGKNNISDSTINAKGNVELFAKDNLTLDGVTSTSQQHTALNSKKNIYINSQAGANDAPVFTSAKATQFTTQGVLSATSAKNQNIQNAKLTGGAVLIEAGEGLNTLKSVELNATGSALLKNDKKLNSLDGDLTIQSNNALTIDPKIHNLKATGDIELISKAGALTFVGHSGTNGNGSEQVVKLDTTTGGISLEGTKVELQGSQLNAQKDIKVVSSNGDVLIDGIKSQLSDYVLHDKILNLNEELSKYSYLRNDVQNNGTFKNDKVQILQAAESYRIASNEFTLDGQYNPSGGRLERYKNSKVYLDNLVDEFKKKYFNSVTVKEAISYPYDDYQNIDYIVVDFSDPYSSKLDNIQNELNFFNSGLNGYNHLGSTLISNEGNINITSVKGTSISGSELTAKTGTVNIEARAPLAQNYTSTAQGKDKKPRVLGASIIVDGTQDFYDKGNENDANYSFRTLINPSVISGSKGVNIKAVGTTADDNLVMQAVGISSQNGNVKIEANKNILFDAAIEQSYDRATKVEKKKSWGGLKKKTVITKTENNDIDAASVDIQGKNVFIESKEKNPNNSIDIYSGKFTADGGKISIRSGGNLNFFTVEESSSSTTDVTKKSSFAGIKYNSSKTNATRDQVTELPAKLVADYIGAKSEFDTRLVGTEFEYLKGATIESGGRLELIAAKDKITELVKKEKNSVVWQSMQDKGSITETAQLPRFNGLTPPEFKAAGGLSVQVPVGEKDQNKVQLRDEILKLANQPGNQYLKDLVNRNDVDWQKVILTQKDWDYKSQGLTVAGAAIIALIVTAVTMGTGTTAALGTTVTAAPGATTVAMGTTTVAVGAGGSATFLGGIVLSTTTAAGATTLTTAGAMLTAAVTTIGTQASVGLINNGGDVKQTLQDLGSKDFIKNLAASVVTAGLLNGVATNLNISSNLIVNEIANKMANGMIQGVGSTLIDSAVNGKSLSEGLEKALLAGLANSLQAPLAGTIGDTLGMSNNAFVSKVVAIAAHAAAGCATGVVDKQCQSRALGAALGEVIAENMFKPANGVEYTEAEKLQIRNISKLTTGVVAAYAGYDVTAAANAADTAVSNNYLSHAQEKQKSQELKDCNIATCSLVVLKWAGIHAGQDSSYMAGFAKGAPTAIAESLAGLVKMALSPLETYKAIKEVINSENALGNITNAAKQEYTNRINKLEAEYQKAGLKGAYNAGFEAGKLSADVASLFAGGAGLAKGGAVLTEKVAAKVGYKVLKDPVIISGKGVPVNLDGHKIYDPDFAPLSTNPRAPYRFSDPSHRLTGGDVYFGENIATSYFEVRQAVKGKSLFVGKVEVNNILDLTDPKILKQMGIDQKKLIQKVNDANEAQKASIYAYTNSIANQAYDKGYSGIIYNSSRNTGSSNNRAVVLFGNRYDPAKIKPVLDKPILIDKK